MEESQGSIQNPGQHVLGHPLPPGVLVLIQGRLDQFDVPVAELVPEELVDGRSGLVEFIPVQRFPHRGNRPVDPAENPLIGQGQIRFSGGLLGVVSLEVGQGEPGRVPYLVGEVPVAGDPVLGEADVPPLRGEGRQGEPEGVGPEFFDHFQGIDDVAPGLAHLLSLGVPHQGMDVHIPEGNIAHEL